MPHSQREGERRLEVGSPTVKQTEVKREREVGPRGTSAKAKAKAKGRKAFDGECLSCGERGHRAQDCRKGRSVTNIGSVEEEQETYVGGVWSIAHVEAKVVDAGWKVVKGRGRWRRTRKDIKEVRTINAVPVESTLRPVGAGEITIDSAAEESVCP